MRSSQNIKILICGDFKPPSTEACIYSEKLLRLFKDKDYSLVNLEVPLTSTNTKISKSGSNHRSSPDSIKHILSGRFNAVTISNNHIKDYGNQGVLDTLRNCQKEGIATIGAGQNLSEARSPLRIEIDERKISFLNYSEIEFNCASENSAGANPFDLVQAYSDIKREKEINDYVIVLYHGGIEYQHLPSPEMIRHFRFMVEIGADAVICHHSHCYSGFERYLNKPIVYGLGNFYFQTNAKVPDSWFNGIISAINISHKGIQCEIIPIGVMRDFSQITVLDGTDRKRIMNHIAEISSLIKDEKGLKLYWERTNLKDKNKYLALLKANRLFEYRILKRLPTYLRKGFTTYKRNNILNILRCESHRSRVIRMFEDEYLTR